ncbi:MAG TPA: GNAT family N-acetyltransferase [Verrucomicrobiae bacterium]|nr:GNAT family N-acetyltransferase [Verrucomicrobiae bacterium]
MNPVTLREARPKDALAIAEIHVKTWQSAYRGIIPDSYLDTLDIEKRKLNWEKILGEPSNHQHTFIAEDGEKVVGFTSVGTARNEAGNEEGQGELYAIYVSPDYKGNGVGTLLIGKAKELLRADGYTKAILWVLTENKGARAFYEKNGWHVNGVTLTDESRGFEMHETGYSIDL